MTFWYSPSETSYDSMSKMSTQNFLFLKNLRRKISKVMTETLRKVKKTCTSRFLTLVWTTIFNPHLTIALSVKSSIPHNKQYTVFVNFCHSKVGFCPSQAQTLPVSRFVLSSYMKEDKSLIVCVASFLTFNTNQQRFRRLRFSVSHHQHLCATHKIRLVFCCCFDNKFPSK